MSFPVILRHRAVFGLSALCLLFDNGVGCNVLNCMKSSELQQVFGKIVQHRKLHSICF